MVTVKITGLDELQRKLEEVPRQVSRNILRRALRKAANIIRDAMVSRAPKATGFLAEHFGVRVKTRRADISASAFIGPDHTLYPVKEGKNAEQVARYHEFGTTKMSATPFMSQGFEEAKQQALDTIVEELKSSLKEATK